MSTRGQIESRISEAIDLDYGQDTETTLRYHEAKDAIEVRVVTTIKGKKHDFWYFYPLWWVSEHRIERQYSEDFDVEAMIEEVTAAAAREFVWSHYDRPTSGLVSQFKLVEGLSYAINTG